MREAKSARMLAHFAIYQRQINCKIL